MSLESATYVNQLVISNPDGADPKGQGDDHLRLIKNTLKNTFPNLNAAVNATPAEMNSLVGGNATFKAGMILLWSGIISTIPAGWALCNGVNSPDLRDRFVVGAGLNYGPGVTGGVVTHSHTISVVGTSLTVDQIPSHRHFALSHTGVEASPQETVSILNATGAASVGFAKPVGFDLSATYIDLDPKQGSPFISNTGSGATHTHGASASASDNRPPFFALAYIIKV